MLLTIGIAFLPGDLVRITFAAAGMPRGSEGIVLQPQVGADEMLVSFWDGGPLRVPLEAVELVTHAPPPQVDELMRD